MRNSLIEPVKDFEIAAKLLETCADALLAGDRKLVGILLPLANRPAILDYIVRTVGKLSQDVHHQTKLPTCLPKELRDPTRMPNKTTQYSVFNRDGWQCRFCGIKVISKAARNVLVSAFPKETQWVSSEFKRHSALFAMAASLDHVVPHSRGGKNEYSNFVTACYCCQFGRGQFILQEVQLNNPLQREPIIGDWDGLTRLEGFNSIVELTG